MLYLVILITMLNTIAIIWALIIWSNQWDILTNEFECKHIEESIHVESILYGTWTTNYLYLQKRSVNVCNPGSAKVTESEYLDPIDSMIIGKIRKALSCNIK